MPQKGFRDNFFKMTRYNREFTFGRMCRDYFNIVEVFNSNSTNWSLQRAGLPEVGIPLDVPMHEVPPPPKDCN